MIKYNNKHWFQYLLSRSGYFHTEMLVSMMVYGLIVSILVYLELEHHFRIFELPSTFHTVLGLVIGLLLVFRTNTAYDRWWEGRKQLGTLVNVCRHFSLKAKHYGLPKNVQDIIGWFPTVLKAHLREEDYAGEELLSELQQNSKFMESEHKPNYLLNQMSLTVFAAYREGVISGEQLIVLENEIKGLTEVLGACERIKNTPIPFGYTIHLKRILLIYLVTLPFGFIKMMGWYSLPFMLMVFYTMIGIELMGEEIEEPFGTDINDLPVDELAIKIKANVKEISEFG